MGDVNMDGVIQGTAEWLELRRGRATGSNFKACMAKVDKGEAITRRNYRVRLALERLTGKVMESDLKSFPMDQGKEREPFARMALEAKQGYIVEEVSFIPHRFLQAGVSPDGLIGDSGMAEFKCPTAAVHWDYLQLTSMPAEYKAQVMGQLWVANRAWCDFASFSPDFPEPLQLHVIRVYRDEDYIQKLENDVTKFLADVDATVEDMKALALSR